MGRFADEAKRIREVARAFCEVTARVPGTEAILIGDGPQRDDVEAIVAKQGLGLPVRIAGYVDPELVQQHLVECHAIVLLSEYEGLPVSLMEGMACGCVPVCRRTESGIPELVEHGVTGLIIGDEAPDFIDAIRNLSGDPERWERISKHARSLIEADYSHATCAAKWEELVTGLLQAPVTKRRYVLRPKLLQAKPPFDSPGDRRPRPGFRQRIRNQLRTMLDQATGRRRIHY